MTQTAKPLPAPNYSRGAELELVSRFEDQQVTGLAVGRDGRLFVCMPRWTVDVPVSVGEVIGGAIHPYPNAEWNGWRNAEPKSPGDHFVCVQSLVFDPLGFLWVLDPASPGMEGPILGGAKLVKIDVATNQVVGSVVFGDDVAPPGSYLNDVRFSPDARFAYMTDSGVRGALVVADLQSGEGWRVLHGDPRTQAEDDVTPTVEGKPVRRPDGRKAKFSADGIALSADAQTLYWQATTGRTLYSVPTSALQNRSGAGQVADSVSEVGKTHVADGLWIDAADHLYFTNPETSSVDWAERAGGELKTLVSDPRMVWPDTFSQGADGALYVTTSHIPEMTWFEPGAGPTPSEIWRLVPRAEAEG